MLENKAFVLNGTLDATFSQRPVPDLAPDEVLVEIKKTGICGSDLHFYAEGRLENNVVTQPFVLGHESAGVIAKVGTNVKSMNIGDRVCMEPASTCRVCNDCKSGKYQLCQFSVLASKHPKDGTLQRYYKLPADLTYKLPEHLTLEDGAMMEPLSVAVHAVAKQGQLRAGQNVAVFGAGPIGLLCMAVSRALGAMRVIAIDIVPSRLEFARKYAATEAFLPPLQQEERRLEYSKKAVEMMKKTFGVEERGPQGIGLIIDATGAETCIQMALLLAKMGGTIVQVGFGAPEVQVPITIVQVKELTVKGSFCYGPGDFPLALGLASSGKVNLKPLVTHRFKFDDAISAFETTRSGESVDESGKVKTVIKTIISGPDVNPSEQ